MLAWAKTRAGILCESTGDYLSKQSMMTGIDVGKLTGLAEVRNLSTWSGNQSDNRRRARRIQTCDTECQSGEKRNRSKNKGVV